MSSSAVAHDRSAWRPAGLIVAAGVCAALHVAKLPPSVPVLQQSLSITLLQAGFLLSILQAAGMLLGVAIGALADGFGARRSMLAGLCILAAASAAGGWAQGLPLLMLLRGLEGLGFLLVVLPGPGWLRQLTPAARLNGVLGFWSAYMPLATALALGVGPLVNAAWGWPVLWWGLALLTALMALALARGTAPVRSSPGGATTGRWRALAQRLAHTLSAPAPWLVAAVFALYAFQWLAVIGFLPTLVLQAGFSAAATGALTALVAAANIAGNLGAGRWLQRGVKPGRLMAIGLLAMAAGAAALFAGTEPGSAWPVAARLAGALVFSACGGFVPLTLFTLALRAAPSAQTVATTQGWVQQGSALGQFCGPPAVAAVAAAVGGWQWSAAVTGSAAALALLLVPALLRVLGPTPAR